IWLARQLEVEEVGVIAYASFFVFLSSSLVDMGFAAALIQKDSISREHIESVFFVNLAIGITLFAAILIWADSLGLLLNEPMLSGVLQPLSAKFLFGAVAAVPMALLKRNMMFKEMAIINTLSLCVGTLVGVFIVMKGGGVWGLIAQQLLLGVMQAIGYMYVNGSSFNISFKYAALKELLQFSVHSFSIRMIGAANQQGTNFIIGYLMGTATLGVFSVANRIHQTLNLLLHEVVSQVLFPVFSSIQDDRKRISSALFTINKGTGYLLFPIYLFLVISGQDMVITLVGDRWSESGRVLSILAIGGLSTTIVYTTSTLIVSIGRPDVINYLNSLGTIGKLCVFSLFSYAGLATASIAWIVFLAVMFPIRMYYFKKVYDYEIGKYIHPFLKPLTLTFVSGMVTFLMLETFSFTEGLNRFLFSLLVFFAIYSILIVMLSKDDLSNGYKLVLNSKK
ncbi:MAG: lipopolysaccharide biosynthesis protein, partial [Candidatus Thiodiazotropha sp.]